MLCECMRTSFLSHPHTQKHTQTQTQTHTHTHTCEKNNGNTQAQRLISPPDTALCVPSRLSSDTFCCNTRPTCTHCRHCRGARLIGHTPHKFQGRNHRQAKQRPQSNLRCRQRNLCVVACVYALNVCVCLYARVCVCVRERERERERESVCVCVFSRQEYVFDIANACDVVCEHIHAMQMGKHDAHPDCIFSNRSMN
jgi:hypothetical protein